jgi:hypothetical protein
MHTLPTELINETLSYLPFHELWRQFKASDYKTDPIKDMTLCSMRRSHGFELSHNGFQHELTMQLAELEIRTQSGRKRNGRHKASCIEYLAKHNAKTICRYFGEAIRKDVDNQATQQRCCMDTLTHYVNEVALSILRQALDMTRIPTTLVTLHFKICQYLLSAWMVPTPRTYRRLHRFLWTLPYSESEELYSSMEGSLWSVAQEAFVIILKTHVNIKIESDKPLSSAPSSRSLIFDLYVSQTHSPKESLLRLACICGITLNLGGSVIESFEIFDDPDSMFGLCLSVCESTAYRISDKILASSCILTFLVKSDDALWKLPALAKACECWQTRLLVCLEDDATKHSEELQLILKVSKMLG